MQIFIHPGRETWTDILKRPVIDPLRLSNTVMDIIQNVQSAGDAALLEYTKQFDGITLSSIGVGASDISDSEQSVEPALKKAIQVAAANIRRFHEAQLQVPEKMETMPGIQCWRKSVGIDKVGVYIPGGSAPLFSTVLMLGIPASIAGCREIILCTPPEKSGNINPAVLYAAKLVGISRIFKLGGAQAIVAMAVGTASVPKVFKIFGPGNQYVTAAKQLVQQFGVAIDMPAGPSEVAVFADATANVAFIAADLLSQAEHGPDSQVILVSTSREIIEKLEPVLQAQLELLPRKEIAARALENSKVILVEDENTAMDILNEYAPEHLILNTANAAQLVDRVINAGSVFVGPFSPESAGDYASGTNHALPTNGYARAYSGVSVDSFVKKISFQQLSARGLDTISTTINTLAEAEGLLAHAHAVSVRTMSPEFVTALKNN